MNKERELLRKILKANIDEGYLSFLGFASLKNEIQELLAQPEQAVAECTNSDTWNCKYCNKTESCGALKDSRNFAPPTREPLSEKEIVKLWANKSPANEFECVRLVEKAHGIGVDDENG